MMEKKRIGVLLLAIAMLLSGCSLLPEEEEELAPPLIEPEEVSYKTVSVEVGSIERELKGTATLISYNEDSYYYEVKDGVFKEIYVAVGQEVSAGDLLAEIDSGTLNTQIQQTEITKKKQQLQLENYKAQYQEAQTSQEKRDLQLQIDLLNLDIQSTNITYQDLQQQKAETQLIAESDGIVAYIATAYSPGDLVPAYETMVTVADPDQLQLYYESSSAKEASKGMTVTYQYNGQELTGEVLQSPKDVPADGNSLYSDALLMSCTAIPEELSWGDTMSFSIIVASATDTLTVPRTAISEYSSKYYVDVLDGESKYSTEVTIGIIGSDTVQILGGLEEGMQVIVG